MPFVAPWLERNEIAGAAWARLETDLMQVYHRIAEEAPNPTGCFSIMRYLCRKLPDMWADEYLMMTTSPSELLTITFKDRTS
jgi:hypothetical protein